MSFSWVTKIQPGANERVLLWRSHFLNYEKCVESFSFMLRKRLRREVRVMSSNPEWINFFLLCAVFVILFSFVCAASANALFSSLGSFLNEMVPPVLWMIYIETLLALRLFRERSVCFVLVRRESVRNPVKDTDEHVVCPVHVTFYWFFFFRLWLIIRTIVRVLHWDRLCHNSVPKLGFLFFFLH